MRLRWLLLVGGALVALAPVAWADPPSDAREIRGLLEGRHFTAEQTQAVLALLDGADRRGLPVRELVDRVREGIARRASARAILGVVQDRVGQLERADDIVRRCAQEGVPVRNRERVLVRLADSLAQGVAPGDIMALLPAARGHGDVESVAHAAEVMGRLERKGFSTDETRDVVAAAVAERWPTDRMDELVGLFLEADFMRVPTEELVDLLREGIHDKKQPPGLLRKMDETASKSHGWGRHKGRPTGRGRGAAKGGSGKGRGDKDKDKDDDED